MSDAASYPIGGLAQAAGVSRRTVRFYIERGLLAAPESLGRGARYTHAHLARLLQIKAWQEQGVSLDEIRARLSGRPGSAEGPRAGRPGSPGGSLRDGPARGPEGPAGAIREAPGTAWYRQPLVAGYELHVAAGTRPLTAHQLARLARALGDIVNNGGEEA